MNGAPASPDGVLDPEEMRGVASREGSMGRRRVHPAMRRAQQASVRSIGWRRGTLKRIA